MRYRNVCLEALGYCLPEQAVSSDALEARLEPAYTRLRLPEGRLELMTGIVERRFFPPNARLGAIAADSGRRALSAANFDRAAIGALAYGSVCRDFLEPATACSVHHRLELPERCEVYDVSNACLGILSGMIQVADKIELGQIGAGLVVGAECGRPLVDNTVQRLNEDATIDRQQVKHLFASLTIGSGSVAALLCHADLSQSKNRLLGGSVLARTDHHELCQSEGLNAFMQTDSEQLMRQGVAAGAANFEHFLAELEWDRGKIGKTICHQVGAAHRKLMFEQLRLNPTLDFSTFERLGNTGAAALPLTLALAAEANHLQRGDQVALLGIGSGVNCLMLGVDWHESRVAGNSQDVGWEIAE